MISDDTVRLLAQELHDARQQRRELAPLSQAHEGLDVEAGYVVQRAGEQLRLSEGERIIGFKMGLTSKAKREQMNLKSPCYGFLTDRMQVLHDGEFQVGAGIHPKIEPEIAFRIGRELKGKITFEEALAAITEVGAAMEILDSRFKGFKYFSLPDVVADNSSSSHFVLSDRFVSPQGVDLSNAMMRMSVNGEVKQSASSSAISGHPVESIVQLVEMLTAHGRSLPAGSIVLAGAATVAEPLAPGHRITLEVERLPSVTVRAV